MAEKRVRRVSGLLWYHGYVAQIDPWLEEVEARTDLRGSAARIGRGTALDTTLSGVWSQPTDEPETRPYDAFRLPDAERRRIAEQMRSDWMKTLGPSPFCAD